jgi:hypothetical protein
MDEMSSRRGLQRCEEGLMDEMSSRRGLQRCEEGLMDEMSSRRGLQRHARPNPSRTRVPRTQSESVGVVCIFQGPCSVPPCETLVVRFAPRVQEPPHRHPTTRPTHRRHRPLASMYALFRAVEIGPCRRWLLRVVVGKVREQETGALRAQPSDYRSAHTHTHTPAP